MRWVIVSAGSQKVHARAVEIFEEEGTVHINGPPIHFEPFLGKTVKLRWKGVTRRFIFRGMLRESLRHGAGYYEVLLPHKLVLE